MGNPIAGPRESRDLMLLRKERKGMVFQRTILPLAFVPLTRREAGGD